MSIVEARSKEDKPLTWGEKERDTRAWRTEVRPTAAIPGLDPAISQSPANAKGNHGPGELVAGIRAGDESAWRAMTEQYEPLLRWLSRRCRLSAEDADDAVQLTWLRCLEHID
jgi:Sigma-70 region 2